MLFNKKGSEKPIEIFVGLFVVVTVSLILIALFRDQVNRETESYVEIHEEQKSQLEFRQAQSACLELCRAAENANCNSKIVASFCAYKSGFDVDGTPNPAKTCNDLVACDECPCP
ncbi:hypothetical protein H6504_01985 [Candidatus Woesearchaeota archaeon]|nr:hypothetical protein [Candidatus Woesearchaeota archaeon]